VTASLEQILLKPMYKMISAQRLMGKGLCLPSPGWSKNKRTASKRHTRKKQNTRYANPSVNTINLRRVKGHEPTDSPGGQEEEAHAYSQRVEGGITTSKARPVSTFSISRVDGVFI